MNENDPTATLTAPPVSADDAAPASARALWEDYKREVEQAVHTAEVKLADAKEAVQHVEEVTPRGSFADRVTNRRVSLLGVIEEGIPPVEYLPASEGIFVKGGRHHIAAPKKSGKSFAILSHAVRMALAGARVAILDRENGTQRYARRLELVMDYLGLDAAQRHAVDGAISYYAFPSLRKGDHDEMVAEFAEADLVVFDSQRQFLTALGYKEDSADDYAEFMALMIEPLFDRQIATLILDNAGHKEQERGRGTSAKGDVNDILFSLKKTLPFDEQQTGEVVLTVEESRDGNTGSWAMRIGNGVFEGFGQRADAAPATTPDPALLERASRAIEEEPGIATAKLRNALVGSQAKRDAAVDWLVENGHVARESAGVGNAVRHTSIRPYRA
jgi:hypothetical protein